MRGIKKAISKLGSAGHSSRKVSQRIFHPRFLLQRHRQERKGKKAVNRPERNRRKTAASARQKKVQGFFILP